MADGRMVPLSQAIVPRSRHQPVVPSAETSSFGEMRTKMKTYRGMRRNEDIRGMKWDEDVSSKTSLHVGT